MMVQPDAITVLHQDEVELIDGGIAPVTWAVACAIVGIAVSAFNAGYQFGKDLAT